VQAVRENWISHTTFNDVASLNQWVWTLIRASDPNSVFVNYQLVDVLWANPPAVVPRAAAVPLTAGNPLPNPMIHKVANTTLKTIFKTLLRVSRVIQRQRSLPLPRQKWWPLIIHYLFGMADSSSRRNPDLRRGT
jgi:hypothetical protein